jgi:hypothetical protein
MEISNKTDLMQTLNGEPKCKPQSQEITQHSTSSVQVYESKDEFLIKFNPKKQNEYIKHFDRCFVGNALRLTDVACAYEEKTAIFWIKIQLLDLALFTGVKKPSDEQITMLCETILANYGYLKVTELMVFFSKFKAGQFERFFGNFDAMVITTSLATFIELRKNWIFEAYQRQENEKREKRHENTIPMPDYLQQKIKKL